MVMCLKYPGSQFIHRWQGNGSSQVPKKVIGSECNARARAHERQSVMGFISPGRTDWSQANVMGHFVRNMAGWLHVSGEKKAGEPWAWQGAGGGGVGEGERARTSDAQMQCDATGSC